MNFLKNSIFSRGAGDSSPDWEPENENQMLAVWGSPGSGKTTTAVKLAARLAMQKKDVALLLCDMNTPMLPCICPPGDLEEEHSLGSVLAATHVSESVSDHLTEALPSSSYGFPGPYGTSQALSGIDPFPVCGPHFEMASDPSGYMPAPDFPRSA